MNRASVRERVKTRPPRQNEAKPELMALDFVSVGQESSGLEMRTKQVKQNEQGGQMKRAQKQQSRRNKKPVVKAVRSDKKDAGQSAKPSVDHPNEEAVRQRLARHKNNVRFQHELQEMRETHDLDDIDDDVERVATLFEWHAKEHEHRPKSPVWFAVLAAAITVLVGLQLFFFANFIGAIVISVIGGLIYYVAQQKPKTMRYRILVDGVALNNTLYHYRELASFNVIYEPGETKTVIMRSVRLFAPFVHMEIGDADPVEIRDILLEFMLEDLELDEPLVDIWARRLGF